MVALIALLIALLLPSIPCGLMKAHFTNLNYPTVSMPNVHCMNCMKKKKITKFQSNFDSVLSPHDCYMLGNKTKKKNKNTEINSYDAEREKGAQSNQNRVRLSLLRINLFFGSGKTTISYICLV